MTQYGKQASAWLDKITKDQNLNELDEITRTPWNTIRRWFVSRMINPMIKMGYYDPATGYPVLGSPSDSYTWESEFTTASAAALTLTCPAGYRMDIHHASAWNATQASTCTITASISGNTLTLITGASGTTANTGAVIGAFTGLSNAHHNIPIGLSAGDSITLTLNTYAAGNDTQHQIIYKLYRVV